MKKENVMNFLKTVQNGMKKHSPEILVALGIAGMATTVILAVKETPKAMKLIDAKKEELGLKPEEKLPPIETVKTAWKPYVKPAIVGVASTACIIGSSSIHVKRNAALMTAYQISNTALAEWKQKATEALGKEKVQEIQDKIKEEKKEHLSKSNTGHNTYIVNTDEEILFKEPISNQVFRSTLFTVEKAALNIARQINNGPGVSMSLNEFLYELGLRSTPIGNDIGWNLDNVIDITFEDGRTDSMKPCFEIVYLVPPIHKYDEYCH